MCIKFNLNLTFGKKHQSRLGHRVAGTGGSTFLSCGKCCRVQDRGCRRVYSATHTFVVTSVPQVVTSHIVCPCRRCNPQRLPCSVTKSILPAGLAVTDSEETSNSGLVYKVY